MTAAIIIGIYLVGYVGAYLLWKYAQNWDGFPLDFRKPANWLVRNRIKALFAGLFSWLTICIWLIFVFFDVIDRILYSDVMNKPAKW